MAGDEGILAEIPNIEVKSIEFRLFLTNRRLILSEDNNRTRPPVIVPLQVIRKISPGKNFSDDPTLKLSLSAPDGSVKKMVLSFTQDFSGVRDKERDQLKKVMEGVVSESQMTVKSAPAPGSSFPEYQDMNCNSQYPGDFQGQSPQPPYGCGGHPQQEFHGGVILTAQNVVVKSQEYTASLSNDKITLTDPNRPNKPSSIPLGSVRSAESETSEQGEPAVALMVEIQNGNIRRMVLRFSQWYDKNRWGEREVWVRAIQDVIATGSVGELYRPTEADSTPQYNNSDQYSARPPSDVYSGSVGGRSGGIIDSESYGSGYDEGYGDFDRSPDSGRKHPRSGVKKVRKAPKRRKPAGDDMFGGRRGGPAFDENSTLGRLIGFIKSPADAFQGTRGQDAVDAVPTFIISVLIFVIGNAVFLNWYASSLDSATYPVLSTFSNLGNALVFVVEIAVLIALFTVIYGILLHLSVVIIGYRSELNDGVRISLYSATAFVAGIIPLAGIFIIPFWGFILQVIGLRETYSLSGGQALVSALIPAFVALLLFYFFIISGESSFSIFGGA
ncbi:hypothetical protein J2128_002440 [Methanomicrobium sp. W14]|uniref:YIP1 family protein n=1 Tax=Methanomicrobium sp. W14 TaxID=2817839 RepID=UPI001AE68C81|nr:Yip1 family protein [Methanomicrobium sp. W14]MBP2134474.1 hypothetical protein [Methanomicrobium sp. W14]